MVIDNKASATAEHTTQATVQVERSVAGLARILARLRIRLRYNTRARAFELSRDMGPWRRLTDIDEKRMRGEIVEGYAFKGSREGPWWISAERWGVFIASVATARDPFLEWLLCAKEWDGTPRLLGLLWQCFAVPPGQDPDLVKWASAAPLMTAAARTVNPGTIADTTVVLVGPQACGKSSFTKALLPPEFRRDGHGTASLLVDDKAFVEATVGRILVEIPEMVGVRRAEVEQIKARLSASKDTVRRAYGRVPEEHLRMFAMIGTTNRTDFLPPDPSGNRRLAPVRVGPHPDGYEHVRDWIDEHREQLWAEALHSVKAGAVPQAPAPVVSAVMAASEGHRVVAEALEDVVDRFLVGKSPGATFAMSELVGKCDGNKAVEWEVPKGPAGARMVGDVLRARGCVNERERVEIGGKWVQQRRWRVPGQGQV